jgi:spermine synthase
VRDDLIIDKHNKMILISKFMTHGNGASCPESLRMYEEQLEKLSPKVKYARDTAFVPSFMEDWIFYQVSLDH